MTDSDDHLPDPHEDQHVAHLSPWVAEQFTRKTIRRLARQFVEEITATTPTERPHL